MSSVIPLSSKKRGTMDTTTSLLNSGIASSDGYNAINSDETNNGKVVNVPKKKISDRGARWLERLFFFMLGAGCVFLLFAPVFHLQLYPSKTTLELEKELEIEEEEVNEEEIEIVQEEKEIQADANELARMHASLARERVDRCRKVDWLEACDRVGKAGARRRQRRRLQDEDSSVPEFDFMEEALLDSDDPAVFFDENCLRLYRIKFDGDVTFPYHASQLLHAGGQQTMALFIQHGAMRDADHYFCSIAKLMLEQNHRPFKDILVIAPNFEYKRDYKVYPYDAFWNSTKPWGDWRDGAQSDPDCCGNTKNSGHIKTVSSFDVLDQMLGVLVDRELYPNMNKITILGHSAGGQMVQRYSIMSLLAAAYDDQDVDWIDMRFVVANPSSYTYLDERRFSYNCGHCVCTPDNCTCPRECTEPSDELSIPSRFGVGQSHWPCFDSNYNSWPYGLNKVLDPRHTVPYVVKSGPRRAARSYYKRDIVYMVGQNDTCNDGLPVCDSSCWKREEYEEGEWPCFRNSMDTRCPAMLEGPFRRTRGIQYMKYLEQFYGKPTHQLVVVPGMGHNATGMFGSPMGLDVIFG